MNIKPKVLSKTYLRIEHWTKKDDPRRIYRKAEPAHLWGCKVFRFGVSWLLILSWACTKVHDEMSRTTRVHRVDMRLGLYSNPKLGKVDGPKK